MSGRQFHFRLQELAEPHAKAGITFEVDPDHFYQRLPPMAPDRQVSPSDEKTSSQRRMLV
jgi:hypothetical protein